MKPSDWGMVGLLVIYAVISVLCGLEKNWPRLLYWVSAFFINASVMWGMR